MTDVLCNSFVAGISQTVIGHPFDTVKTLKQMNNRIGSINIVKNLVKNNGVKYMYRGFFPPLIGGCIQNCFLFSSENYINKYITNNPLYSGFIAGGITSIAVSPFELVKCNLQINKDTTIKKIISKKGFKYFKGCHLTFLRDSIGFSIYFGTYKFLQEKYNNPLINGGISGTLSWIYSYPIDVVKTKYKLSNKTIIQILKKETSKSLVSGMNIMLLRAFCVNAGIFYVFEKLSNNI
jgi:solute carrier family 25 (mitochondrial carnitine/acylcarnitine transporter), member 20/29